MAINKNSQQPTSSGTPTNVSPSANSGWLIQREFMYLFALPAYIVGSAGKGNDHSKEIIKRSILTNIFFWGLVITIHVFTKKSVAKFAVYLYVGLSMIILINQIRKMNFKPVPDK